ncbi:MAG: sigma 54-interacting transcriptional regulator [Saprospiraceae bacterium]
MTLLSVQRVNELCNIKSENAILRDQIHTKFDLSAFVGINRNIQSLFEHIKIVANTNTTVLITGETGTGKELLTNIIHFNSDRKNKPFIKVSCAILNKEIFEEVNYLDMKRSIHQELKMSVKADSNWQMVAQFIWMTSMICLWNFR